MKRKSKFLAAGMIITVLLCLSANPPKKMQTIEQILHAEIEAGKAPSVQYYLFDKEQILNHVSTGFADVGQQQKADTNTTYHAFSVTKTFTALAVLQLAEKGAINLDAPIINYLSDFPYGREITIRQILSHSAGIPNPIPLSWIHPDTAHKQFDRDLFFEKIFDKHPKTTSKPNTKFAYSNLGYVILGQLIEKISGKSYEDYISQNIIEQLALHENDLTFEIADHSTHAKGYHKKWSFTNLLLGFFIDKSTYMAKAEGKWEPFNYYYVNGPSYGGLIGKPTAFVKYIQELLKSDSQLISPEYKQLLFRENKNDKNESTGMCLSWFTGQLNGHDYFAHAGGGGGYYCEIRIYPGLGLGSVIFFNRTGMKDERYLDQVDDLYINRFQ